MSKYQPYYKNKNGELVPIELPYQDELESGVNIKTVNGESILGNGNIFIENSSSKWVKDNGGKLYSTKKYYVKIPGGLESLSYEEGYLIATTNYNNYNIYLLKNTTNDVHVLLTDPSDISVGATFSMLSQTQGEQDIYEFTTLELFDDYTYISSDNAIAYLVKLDNISRVFDLTNYSSGDILDDETYKTIKENPSSVFLLVEDPIFGAYVLANYYYTEEYGISYSYFWKEPDTNTILSGYVFIDTDKIISFETYEEELVTRGDITRLNSVYDISDYRVGDEIASDYEYTYELVTHLRSFPENIILRITSYELGVLGLAQFSYKNTDADGDIFYFEYVAFELNGGTKIEQGTITLRIISNTKINYGYDEHYITDVSGSGGIETGTVYITVGDDTSIDIGSRRDVKILLANIDGATGILRFYISASDGRDVWELFDVYSDESSLDYLFARGTTLDIVGDHITLRAKGGMVYDVGSIPSNITSISIMFEDDGSQSSTAIFSYVIRG